MTTIDRQNSTKILSQLVYNTRKGSYPKVYLLHGNMTSREMAGLYSHPKVKALVNLARAEGFCLPALEAAAVGLPVITTNWSAQTEFLNKGKFIKVDYNLQPIHPTRVDGKIFVKDSKWAMPIEADAKRKLKKFYESPSIPEGWATELKTRIRQEYSQKAIEAIYSKTIGL
jgi:glycosyltransferase involved in cell wall biosynthesis